MQKPQFTTKIKKKGKNYGKFFLEPLEQGYGYTLGNALRRCLLTSLPGAAITRIKIAGVRHQFSTLRGMKQDTIEFILNLKQLRIKYNGKKPAKLKLFAKGPAEVLASKIKTPANLEIVNKELKLADLSRGAKLKVEMEVEAGFSYVPASQFKTTTLGVISLDAIFTPVKRVNYKVEATRVGQRTDLDRLVLEIWTDGTITPKEALEKSTKVLVAYFKQVYQPTFEKEVTEEKKIKVDEEALQLTVEEINLPTRIVNALQKTGYKTLKDLTRVKSEDIKKVKNLGTKSIQLISKKLMEKNLSFKE